MCAIFCAIGAWIVRNITQGCPRSALPVSAFQGLAVCRRREGRRCIYTLSMAYVLVTIKEIQDQQAFDEYAQRVRPILNQFEGRWVAIEPQHVTRAGAWPYVRTVVVEFPTIDHAQRWYDSPEYREIIPLRQRAIDANIVMVRSLGEKG